MLRVSQKRLLMLKLFQLLVFLPLQCVCLPLLVLGLIAATYKEMVVSRWKGVSFTAGQAIQPRWMMHYFNVREDKLTVAFMKALPIESHWGLMACLIATILANRICGFTLSFARMPRPGMESLMTFMVPRSIHFDRLMKENLERVDQEKTQIMKLETMRKVGIAHDWVSYIPIDFRYESWVQKLLDSGFDQSKRTLFHWENVSCYLEPEVVRDTLQKMADLGAEGRDTVSADLAPRRPGDYELLKPRSATAVIPNRPELPGSRPAFVFEFDG